MVRVVDKLEKLIVSYEYSLKGARLAARASDFDQMYKALGAAMPEKVKVAMYIVNELEHDNFDFARLI